MVPTVPAHDFERVYWVAKRGKVHGFTKSPETMKPGEIGEIVEYKVVGIVKDSFLHRGFQARTIVVQIDLSHIEQIKAIVRTLPSPNFTESLSYHWPIENQLDAKLTSKVGLNDDFAAIGDGRKIDVHDVGSRVGLSIAEIEEGTKVLVEYAILASITPHSVAAPTWRSPPPRYRLPE
jgi:hypothetical protein